MSVDHLYQVRSMLEVESAGRAAENASESDIEGLCRICTEMDMAASDPALFAQKDTEFHSRLAHASGNPLIPLLLDSIGDLMAEVRSLVAHQPGLFERVMPGHRRILLCVANRDPQGARSAMADHVATALAVQKELAKNGTFDDVLARRKKIASAARSRAAPIR